MKYYSKKLRKRLFLSKRKKIIILSIICCLFLGGLSPTIINVFVKDAKSDPQTLKDVDNNDNTEYKKLICKLWT